MERFRRGKIPGLAALLADKPVQEHFQDNGYLVGQRIILSGSGTIFEQHRLEQLPMGNVIAR